VTKSEPQHLGKNDAANGPFPYRAEPKLDDIRLFPGMKSVQPEQVDLFDTHPGRTLYEGK
jgi:hypothetical protein